MAKKKKRIRKTKILRKVKKKRVIKAEGKAKKVKAGKIEILEDYKVKVDNAEVKVKIMKEREGTIYNLDFPEINIATAALLDEVRQELVSEVSIGLGQAINKEEIEKTKKRFIIEASKILREIIPKIDKKTEDFLIGKLMQDMLGLGEVEFLINDPNLEEVVIPSSTETIRAYHKKYGWLKTNLKVANEDAIVNYANIIARRVGRQINVLTPLLDAHIVSGDRNLDIASLLWLAIEYEMNIIISGGTASGKTVFLNCCMVFMPPNHRIISIEDTRELTLPDHLYWTPLVTRIPNVEGKGGVSMLDLLINSLRMRPDRIILGEMRRQREAEVLFEAMHTGHSVYATLHADTASETISRLTNPPINVPINLLKGVNLNVVMFRDRRRGIRRVYQVAEFDVGKETASANLLYRYIPDKDVIQKHGESLKFFEELSRHTGLSNAQMSNELKIRKNILEWMVKNNISRLHEVSKIMSLYYNDRENLIKMINKNTPPAKILNM